MIVAVLFADHDVVGEVDLDGSLNEVGVLVVPLFPQLLGPIIELLYYIFALGTLGPPPHQVLFVVVFVDGGVVAAGLALVLALLHLAHLPLQLLPLLFHLPQGLSANSLTSNS